MRTDLLSLSTDEFIANIAAVAESRFDCQTYPQQNLPADDWALLVRAGVTLPAIPKDYGGRDSHVEMCRVVEAIAEWSLPLGMYTKIITAVVLRPIALRASEQAKREVLPLFAGPDPRNHQSASVVATRAARSKAGCAASRPPSPRNIVPRAVCIRWSSSRSVRSRRAS